MYEDSNLVKKVKYSRTFFLFCKCSLPLTEKDNSVYIPLLWILIFLADNLYESTGGNS